MYEEVYSIVSGLNYEGFQQYWDCSAFQYCKQQIC